MGGDLNYLGPPLDAAGGTVATPRRKPRAQERPEIDGCYNRTFARVRVEVARSSGRVRRYQALNATDRHQRTQHTERVPSVAGLVNRQIRRHRV